MTSFKHFHGRIKTFDEDVMLPEVERGDSRTDRTSKEYSKKHEKFFPEETSRTSGQQRLRNHVVSQSQSRGQKQEAYILTFKTPQKVQLLFDNVSIPWKRYNGKWVELSV